MNGAFRSLPSVDVAMQQFAAAHPDEHAPHDLLRTSVRRALEMAREAIAHGAPPPSIAEVLQQVETLLAGLRAVRLRRVINATGVILHTNLGRAPLARSASEAVVRVAQGYSNLEFDLPNGARGSRHTAVAALLRELTNAEAALVVNNNASAVLLTLATLVTGKEVLVSRGQLVEIGGGFRIPDVLRQSGALLKEVGTTNRTYAGDFERALSPETAAILRVHPSNFIQQGFVHAPSLAEMAAVAHAHDLFLIDDLGSGAVRDTSQYGLAREPLVQESIRAGADIVCFSGDKLLGGPQAGIILGRDDLVEEIARHPLARAVRIDKLSLAALEATLHHYLWDEAESAIPVWRMISRPAADIAHEAARWQQRLLAAGVAAYTRAGQSTIGGGSLPGETLPTTLVVLQHLHPEVLAARLRMAEPAVVARIEDDHVVLDPRTVLEDDVEELLRVISVSFDAS
ncbi:MAG: L-seryl-tRNA(Sec) selenium transferase [Chloroflexi bacterium]|nr:L-seryl-tRNA(Sec) selenium transferase [Chloroflexota bacterium]